MENIKDTEQKEVVLGANANRLRFVRHGDGLFDTTNIFKTLDDAKYYIESTEVGEGYNVRPSSYGEPIVLLYKNEDDETKLLFGIGMVDGNINKPKESKTFWIDTANLEKSIEELKERVDVLEGDVDTLKTLVSNVIAACGFDENGNFVKIEDFLDSEASNVAECLDALSKYILMVEKKTQVSVEETDSIKMNLKSDENGSVISAEVKLPKTHDFEFAHDLTNQLQVVSSLDDGSGVFINVDLAYNGNGDTLKLIVNGDIVKEIETPLEVHAEKGVYDAEREMLVITLSDGKTIEVDLKSLAGESTVDKNSTTPIQLYRKRVKSEEDEDGEVTFHSILSADVKLTNDEFIENNILKVHGKGTTEASLYVEGVARNIKYGNETVASALNKANKNLNELNEFKEKATEDIKKNAEDIATLRTDVETVSGTIETEIEDAVKKLTLVGDDSSSIDLEVTQKEDGTHLQGVVKIDRDVKGNILRGGNVPDGNGLYATVDASYHREINQINLTTSSSSNGTKLTKLNLVTPYVDYDESTNTLLFYSAYTSDDGEILAPSHTMKMKDFGDLVNNIKYDREHEEIVFEYIVIDKETGNPITKEFRLSVSALIREWDAGTTSTLILERAPEKIDGHDILKGYVKIATNRGDNILTQDGFNGLYVSNSGISQNAKDIEYVSGVASSNSSDIETLKTAINVINGNESEEGSIKKALKDAKDYTDEEVANHKLEGVDAVKVTYDAETHKNTVEVKIDQHSEPYLTQSEDGLMLSGVKTEIDDAVAVEANIRSGETKYLSGMVETVSGNIVNQIETSISGLSATTKEAIENITLSGSSSINIADKIVTVKICSHEGQENWIRLHDDGLVVDGISGAIESMGVDTLLSANTYTDNKVAELKVQVDANTSAIEVINGDAETEGSIANAIANLSATTKDAIDAITLKGDNETIAVSDDNIISVKICHDEHQTENWLRSDSHGLIVDGINTAIENAVAAEASARTEDIKVLSGVIGTSVKDINMVSKKGGTDDEDYMIYTLSYTLNDGSLGQIGNINIPKDKFIKEVTYDNDTHILHIVFVTASGTETVEIPLGGLIDVYEGDKGIVVENNKISVNLHPEEKYLTFDDNDKPRLKTTGIDEAIAEAVQGVTLSGSNTIAISGNVVSAIICSHDEIENYLFAEEDGLRVKGIDAAISGQVTDAINELSAICDSKFITSAESKADDAEILRLAKEYSDQYTLSGTNGVQVVKTDDGVNVASVKLHPYNNTEGYLQVDEQGLWVSGVNKSISDAVAAEAEIRSGETKFLSGAIVENRTSIELLNNPDERLDGTIAHSIKVAIDDLSGTCDVTFITSAESKSDDAEILRQSKEYTNQVSGNIVSELTTIIDTKADKDSVYTKEEVDIKDIEILEQAKAYASGLTSANTLSGSSTIEISGNVVSVKICHDEHQTENWLRSDSHGLIVDGINTAIENAVAAEANIRSGETKSLSGAIDDNKKAIELLNNPDERLDGTIAHSIKVAIDDLSGATDDRLDNISIVQSGELQYTLKIGNKDAGEINIPKDQFLKSVSYEDGKLIFEFITKDSLVPVKQTVDISALIDEYTATSGITINDDKQFTIKLASTEKYLEISEYQELVTKGIDEAISDAVSASEVHTGNAVEVVTVDGERKVNLRLCEQPETQQFLFIHDEDNALGISGVNEAIDAKISGATSGIVGNVYTKVEVDNLLEGKADKNNVYTKSETYSQTEVNNLLATKANVSDVYSKTESDNKFVDKVSYNSKVAELVQEDKDIRQFVKDTNIETINIIKETSAITKDLINNVDRKVDSLSSTTDNRISSLSATTESLVKETSATTKELINNVDRKVDSLSSTTDNKLTTLSSDTKTLVERTSANTISYVNSAITEVEKQIASAITENSLSGSSTIEIKDKVVSVKYDAKDKYLTVGVNGLETKNIEEGFTTLTQSATTLQNAVDKINGDETENGSIKKALSDAKAYTDSVKNNEIMPEVNKKANADNVYTKAEVDAKHDAIATDVQTVKDNLAATDALAHDLKTAHNGFSVNDTTTVNLTAVKDAATSAWTLSADVLISTLGGNTIKVDEAGGIYSAPSKLTYETGKNQLNYVDENGVVTEIKLNTVETIKQIDVVEDGGVTYLQFTYNEDQKVRINAADFFKGIVGTNDGNVEVTTALTTTQGSTSTGITANLDVAKIIDNTETNVVLSKDVETNKIRANVDVANLINVDTDEHDKYATVNFNKTDNNKIEANVGISTLEDNVLTADNKHDLYVSNNAKNYMCVYSGETMTVQDALGKIENGIDGMDNIYKVVGVQKEDTRIEPYMRETFYLKDKDTVIDALKALDAQEKITSDRLDAEIAKREADDITINSRIDALQSDIDVEDTNTIDLTIDNHNVVSGEKTTIKADVKLAVLDTVGEDKIVGNLINKQNDGIYFDGSIDYGTF